MIIPSIDLMGGDAVQLVGGRELALNAGDPRPIAKRFGLVGEVALIDLDAALGRGSNQCLMEELVKMARCRVGGGIRDVQTARRWLDVGAEKVIMGTAAKPEILCELPKTRVIAALDAIDGRVVVEGWTKQTDLTVVEQMKLLKPYVGGFLVTFVEREGRLKGVDTEQIRELVEAAGDVELTVAGGVRHAAEVGGIDALGADAQVGMALYKEAFDLSEALVACLRSDRPDGLWPTVVTDERGGALGLAYSNAESLSAALATGRGVYHSRRRGTWVKGATSGAVQELVGVDLDCDRDTIRFRTRQKGAGFCHRQTLTCWGEGSATDELERTLLKRMNEAPPGSYSKRLFDDVDFLRDKIREEAAELALAKDPADVIHEASDVFYFAMVAMVKAGVRLADVDAELRRRARLVTRRQGDAKSCLT